ncbi:MAG: RsmE family RNA methyltransferase [Flavobacteriales bacterium]
MHLFFFPHLRVGETVIPDHESVRHLKALRIQPGEHIALTDGKGHRYTGELIAGKKEMNIAVLSSETFTPQLPQLTLAIAPTKNHDRLEWLVEKAVEIGVHRILLIECDHSERPVARMDRLERMAVAALKQSQRYYLPVIEPLKTFSSVIEMPFDGMRFLAHCYDEVQKKLLRDALIPERDALIAIGPEGDFSRDEVYRVEQAGWVSVSLGKSRLRTETAGLAAVHTFEIINQQ